MFREWFYDANNWKQQLNHVLDYIFMHLSLSSVCPRELQVARNNLGVFFRT